MYTIFQDAINAGAFDLNAITRKISKYHIEGLLTDEQRDALMTAARDKADPKGSFGSWQAEIAKVWEAIHDLQTAQPTQPDEDEYPPFKQPTGAHDAYSEGDKFTYKDRRYVVTYPGIKTYVWNPDTYPAGVQEVV